MNDIDRPIKKMEDDLHILKVYIAKIERLSLIYRNFLIDLDANKVQNFTDRIRKVRSIEKQENVDEAYEKLWKILSECENCSKAIKNNILVDEGDGNKK